MLGFIHDDYKNIAIVVISVIVLVVIIIGLFIGGGIYFGWVETDDKSVLEGQFHDKDDYIAKLESDNQKYIIENEALSIRVAELSVSLPDGGSVNEKVKELAAREASLKDREDRISEKEVRIRLAQEMAKKQEREFYERTNMTMQEIGAAKQIREEYENMRISRDRAEDRANNWLIYFSIVLFMFVVLVVASVIFLMYMAAKNRRVENSIRLLDSINLSVQDKNLLISSLGGRLIEHPGKNDDEADKKGE